MPPTLGCLTGATVYRLVETGQLPARELGSRPTPFGPSEAVFIVEDAPAPFYLLPRYGKGRSFLNPSDVNYRANLFALKDLGAEIVVSWTAAGAITHAFGPGHLVIPDDLIDMTHRRPTTFFEHSGLGLLRQFPVFCPAIRRALQTVVDDMNVPYMGEGTVAVTEGPRLETPAEVRWLANAGAQLVTHTLAPDFALAKELQLCFAAVCYLVNYAETGSRHRPLSSGELFGGLTEQSVAERVRSVSEALPQLIHGLLEYLPNANETCDCRHSMAHHIEAEGLSEDWHTWFDRPSQA